MSIEERLISILNNSNHDRLSDNLIDNIVKMVEKYGKECFDAGREGESSNGIWSGELTNDDLSSNTHFVYKSFEEFKNK